MKKKRKIEVIKITFTQCLPITMNFNIVVSVEGMKDLNMIDVVCVKITKKIKGTDYPLA